jgi:hypothetical protein
MKTHFVVNPTFVIMTIGGVYLNIDSIKRSWWVFLFIAAVLVPYSAAVKKKKASIEEMKAKISSLESVYHSYLEEREDLSLQIASLDDPAWIEQILMRDMGLVPEGYIKVHFK